MRILHTSDWHLGRTLEGRSRQKEQEAFVEELCLLADSEAVDLVLLAGDIFDTFNPPAHAEELYYYALERLTAGGQRGVVVISGNHDSPDRLRAVRPLAMRRGAYILGLPGETPQGPESQGGVSLTNAGPGWLELGIKGIDHKAVISALPYPSEARLQQVLSAELEEKTLRQAYSQTVKQIFEQQSTCFSPATVNLAMSHLFILGGTSSESERPIEVGGAYTVDATHLPQQAQYAALGHLHRAQHIKSAVVPTWYSGSPLHYSFSEAGQAKSVCIIDALPGEVAKVAAVPLSSGIPLERWSCKQGVQEALGMLHELEGRSLWLDLEVRSPRYLTVEELTQLKQAHPGIISIRCDLYDTEEVTRGQSVANLSVSEIFTRFYRHRKGGTEPEQELVEVFTDLANKVMTQEAGEES